MKAWRIAAVCVALVALVARSEDGLRRIQQIVRDLRDFARIDARGLQEADAGDAAQGEAREVRRGADEYAAGVLIRLEGECIKALTSIKRGIDMLDERHRGASEDGTAPRPAADALAVDPEEQARTPSHP